MTRQTSHCHGSKLWGRTEPSNSLALRALLVLSWRLKTRLALWHAVVFPSPPQVYTRAFSSH